jgi:hypothetical protein
MCFRDSPVMMPVEQIRQLSGKALSLHFLISTSIGHTSTLMPFRAATEQQNGKEDQDSYYLRYC